MSFFAGIGYIENDIVKISARVKDSANIIDSFIFSQEQKVIIPALKKLKKL